MAESIEAFVKKLQEEGVDAGREAGRQILAEAEKQAEAILEEANERAKAIVDAAQAESEKTRQRTETELRLAARDAVGRLQATLSRALQALLHHPVEEKLRDGDFLAQLIRDVVTRYVEADAANRVLITINVSEELSARLTQWVQETFHNAAETGMPFDLRTSLTEAGFEYKIVEGTVAVTTDSVVDVFLEMVGPELRKLVAAAQEEKVT
jgi:V/A-type H+-transporting ATPase subunit E